MTITISIPTPLRNYTGNNKTVEIDAKSVSEALEKLVVEYPKLKNHLFEDDELRNFVNIYVNDEDIRYLEDKQQTSLQDGDNVAIIPSIAGGI